MSEDASGVNHRNLTQRKDENDNKKKDNECGKKTDNKKQAFKTFPWLRDFDRSCCEAVGTRNIKILETLLSTFIKQVAESIKGCYSRPIRSAKLRTIVKETVIFLNMLYQDSKLDGFADNKDYKNYLNLMTDLMAMYLDLEIKATLTKKDSAKKIGSMMTTSLFVFLDQSEDHIIEAILKAKLVTKTFGELCAPVLAKCLKDGKCSVGNEADYIRYLLAFKLWKKISDKPVRKNIAQMAERKLNPPPQLVDSIKKMTNILPKMPRLMEKMTLFLMNDKNDQFKFLPAKLEFLRTCSISRSSFPSLSDKPIAFSDCLPDSISAVSEKEFKGKTLKESSLDENIWSSALPSGTDAIGLSTDMQKPRVPQLSSDGIESGTTNDEDSDDIDVIECPKPVKPVTVITLDADGESKTAPEESNYGKRKTSKTKEYGFEKEKEESKSKKENKNICLKNKINKKFKNLKLGKKMPNTKKSNKTKDNVIAKEKDRIAQSPEHGVVDSTSSNMGSPKYQVYEIHSNTGDDKLESGSSESNEACSSLLRRSSADSVKISSTLQNSVPFSSYIDCINSSNETNGRVLSSKEIRFSNSRSGPESDNTISNSSVADSSSPVTKALTFEEKTDAESNMSEKENLAYQPHSKSVKTSEFNLHSNLNNSSKQDGTLARKSSVIQNWNGIAKSDQSNFSQVECKTLKVDKNEFKELAKSLKIVKSKDLIPEFNQVASGRSLLKSSYPSINAVTSNDVSSTNRLKVLPQYVKISQEELKNLTNVRKRKTAENNQYYNGKNQHEIVDVVPEVVNEELVCATMELEISSTGSHKNSENTEQKLPQRRNVKSVPIICKPISEEPLSRKKRKVVQNEKTEVDPVINKQIDFPRRMPQLIDEKNIIPLDRPNQKSPSPPILIPANQIEEEPSILMDVNPVSGFINLGDGNPQNFNQDNIQVQNRLCDLFYGSENSNAISNFNMLGEDGQWSVGARDISLGEWREGDDKDPMEEANQIPVEHNSGKDLDEYDLSNLDFSENIDLALFNDSNTYWFGMKDDDENFLKGNISYSKYAKNYPDVISVPCQRVPDCCCIRCSYKRKYFRCFASRRDFFLQLRAARLKRLREADRLKSQDDELLRRIEESFKPKNPEPEDLTTDTNEKKSSLSNLPLKKRLKKLAEENPDSFANIPTTSSEKFPSYPIKPMISIAELTTHNAEKELSYIPPKIFEPAKSNDKIGTVLPVLNADMESSFMPPKILEPAKLKDNIGTVVPVHKAEKELSYIPPKSLEPAKQLNDKIGTVLPVHDAKKDLGYIPPKILEPAKPNDKIGTVLPVQRRQEKKTEEKNPTVKNLPAFEKLVEMHRTAYLAQVKGGKQSPSSVDMMKSFMSPMSMIQPDKNKSQIAQRYDYKISKPLLKEAKKEKIPDEKNDNSTSTKDRKRHSSELKSRKRNTERISRNYQRKEKSSRKNR